jgi:hypothetical protein
VHGIIHAILALLHLDLGSTADADYCDTTCEFGKTLLEFLTVVIGGGAGARVQPVVLALEDLHRSDHARCLARIPWDPTPSTACTSDFQKRPERARAFFVFNNGWRDQ